MTVLDEKHHSDTLTRSAAGVFLYLSRSPKPCPEMQHETQPISEATQPPHAHADRCNRSRSESTTPGHGTPPHSITALPAAYARYPPEYVSALTTGRYRPEHDSRDMSANPRPDRLRSPHCGHTDTGSTIHPETLTPPNPFFLVRTIPPCTPCPFLFAPKSKRLRHLLTPHRPPRHPPLPSPAHPPGAISRRSVLQIPRGAWNKKYFNALYRPHGPFVTRMGEGVPHGYW